jgi:hypothetical protein
MRGGTMRVGFFGPLIGALLVTGTYAGDKPDPCAYITRSEIAAVQGEPVVEAKGSEPERRDFAVSQCFYTLTTFSNSISLEVTRKDRDQPASKSPREHWMKLFHEPPGELDGGHEAGEESGNPQKVAGVGDEAFWTGDRIVGALYVLKGDAYLRISIGGPDEREMKIQRSKRLARNALKRL